MATGMAAARLEPPVAEKIPKVTKLHGDEIVDNYYWLRERDTNPKVVEYIKAENEYTNRMTAHLESARKNLYNEMLGRIQQTDRSVPVKLDDWFYYTRTEENLQYPIYCRKKGSMNANEEVLLDVNELAKGKQFCRLGEFQVNDDHSILAFSVDTDGSEHFTLQFKNLQTGQMYPEAITGTSSSLQPDHTSSFAWANDGKHAFYITLDEASRPYKLFRHKVGTAVDEDQMLFQEEDDMYSLYVWKGSSSKYIFIKSHSSVTSEVSFMEADKPFSDLRLIHPREHGMEYDVEHRADQFYITTNDNGATNFKLCVAPTSSPEKSNWRELVPHRSDVRLDGIDVFSKHLVLYERFNGLPHIRVMDADNSSRSHYIRFDEPVYSCAGAKHQRIFDTTKLRFIYNSLVSPPSVYEYDMDSQDRILLKVHPVLGGYNASEYQSERVFATAEDGTKIPISLVYKKDLFKGDGSNKCLLYGYGSYGMSCDVTFSSNRLALLNRGVVFAIAHIRGGEEMGRQWYEDGKLMKKMNTFTDFITCAKYLVAQRYTSSSNMVINGGSAGGLLMGAVSNMAPNLFKAVVSKVPFVDVINTMLDASIPLTATEWEEWGNPKDEKYYRYMKQYSPYDNIQPKAYPSMLITAGLYDPRVQYWEPAKYTAKLRSLKTDNNVLLLKTNMGAGHAGSSGRYDYLEEIAFEYAFMLDQLD